MANILNGSGPIVIDNTHRTSFSSVQTQRFCSAMITTTDNYADNQIQFGAALSEIVITNHGTKDICFQWIEEFGTTKDSGFVTSGQTVTFRKALKKGIAVRNYPQGQSSEVVIFGV